MTRRDGRRRTGSSVLRCRWLLTMQGQPLEGGWVQVARGRIVAIGRRRPPAPAIDCVDCIALPGFVNAHTHLEFSDLDRPLSPAGGLPDWIERVVALRRGRSANADATAVAAGLEQSLRDGVTAVGEIATHLPGDVVSCLAAAGPRVRVFREALGLARASVAERTTTVARDLDRLARAGLAGGVSPHAPYSVASALGRRLIGIASSHRLPVAMHIAESEHEVDLVHRGRGEFRDLLGRLGAWPDPDPALLGAADWISLLARAPRGLVIHGTHLEADATALARLARHRDRLAVVVCPRTTRALAGRLPPVARLREAGVRIALGTDSRASNPDLSLRAECRALVDAGLVSPGEALACATTNGAWALGFHDSGVLAPGRRADLVVLRPATPSGHPEACALEPATQVVGVMRSGRVVNGALGD